MTLPTPSDVHVNTPLTNMSVAYLQSQDAFIADKVFPTVPVAKQADRYYVRDRSDTNRNVATVLAPNTEPPIASYKLDNTPTYYCDIWAIGDAISDQTLANADSVLSLERNSMEEVTSHLAIAREAVWATQYFSSGIWTNDFSGVASGSGTDTFIQWDQAASTPIEDIRAAKTAVLKLGAKDPNKIVLGREVYDSLVDHADIVDRVKYGQTAGSPAMASRNTLAQLFELEQVLVASAIVNSGAESMTFEGNIDQDFIIGKNALLCYAASSPGINVASAGYTFSWTGYFGTGSSGQRISRRRDEAKRATIIEGEMAFDCKLISADLGYFFGSAVA